MGLYLLAHSHTRWTHWMGCAPFLLTLAPKGVPETPTLVRMMGLSAPALSQADGGKPAPHALALPGASHIMPPTLCPWGSEGATGP